MLSNPISHVPQTLPLGLERLGLIGYHLLSLKYITRLKNLQTLALPSILALKKLHQLRFTSNKLNGTIPNSYTALTTLTALSFHKNNLYGQIPHNIGALTNLKVLNFAHNNFNGEVPRSIGLLTRFLDI
eukprot:g6134.t1